VTATVNGVAVSPRSDETLELAAARELLRQRAVSAGLLDAAAGGEAGVSAAIEALIALEAVAPEPTEEECLRYFQRRGHQFASGDLVCARHILFQVTPGVNVTRLRARAEEALNELLQHPDRFADMARELSNCPSGRHGGNLGQIGRGDVVPEFETALFRLGPTGVLRELARTRYGLHIVAVDERIPGKTLPFEIVRERVAERLRAAVQEKALRQYVSVLAGRANVTGVDLAAAETPLVQ
jgi:peptidyl-prolyl cis-trans isomerase C